MRIAGLVCLLVVAAFADDRADALREGDWTQRNLLLDGLTEEPAAIAIPLLIEALQLEDTFIAARAAQMLRLYGEGARPAVPTLTQALYHEVPGVRKYAFETLHWLGRGAEGASPYVRETRIRAVLQMPPDRRVPETSKTVLPRSKSYDDLIAILRNPDPALREAAARALANSRRGSRSPSAAIEAALRKALGDKAWQVRGRAAESLGRVPIAEPATYDALSQLLRDSSWFVRAKATETLVARRSQTTGHLKQALECGDLRVQRRTAAALALPKCPVELGPPLANLCEQPDRPLRLAAIRALATSGQAKVELLPRILLLLDTDDWEQRQAVYQVLRHLGDSGVSAIPALVGSIDRGEYDLGTVIGVLGGYGRGAQAALIGLYEDAPPRSRTQILQALARDRDPSAAVRELYERGKNDADPSVRKVASAIIAQLPKPDTTTTAELLDELTRTTEFGQVGKICQRLLAREEIGSEAVDFLDDGHWQLRYLALMVISREDRRRPELRPKIDKLRLDPNAHVKRLADYTLRQVSKPRQVDVADLLRQLESDDADQVHIAIRALSYEPSLAVPAVPRLATLAREGDKKMRAAALGLLRRLGVPAARAGIELLSDSDGRLRYEVRKMLGRMRRDNVVPLLLDLRSHKSEQVRVEAVRLLRSHSEVEALVAWLDDDSPLVRKALVEVFVGNRSLRSLPGLLRLLELDESEFYPAALSALGRYKQKADAIVPAVTPFLKHADAKTREFAAATLGVMGRTADSAVDRALASKDPAIRATAVSGIRFRPDGIELLARAFSDEAMAVRLAACRACAYWTAALPLLIAAIEDQFPEVRCEALSVAARIKPVPKAAIPVAIEALNSDKTLHRARDLLLRLFPGSVDAMLARAENLRQDSIRDAFRSFGRRVVPFLLESLASDRIERRRVTIWALGGVGRDAADAVPDLKELAGREPELAADIEAALKRIEK